MAPFSLLSIAEDLRKHEGILIKKDNLSDILKPRLLFQ